MFYNEDNFHADTEVCFDLLATANLGFVHQILTRTRLHQDAVTPFADRVGTSHHAWLTIQLKFGRQYLERREYYARLLYLLRRYMVFLIKAAVKLKFRDTRFRAHHRKSLRYLVRAATTRRATPRRDTMADERRG
jgi:hypothetical protein